MRKRGGEMRKAQKKRTVVSEALPVRALESLADAVTLASWLPVAVLTGEVDDRTADVANRSLREFREAFKAAELERRVKDLESALRDARAELERRP